MNCKTCSEPLKPIWKMCPACSAPIEQSNSCTNCGDELKSHWVSCPSCGSSTGISPSHSQGFPDSSQSSDAPRSLTQLKLKSKTDANRTKNIQDDSIFEVVCMGCGKTAFNLPYVLDSYSSVTCRECGEVTIANVLPEGGLAIAQQKQRDNSFKEYHKKLVIFLEVIADTHSHNQDQWGVSELGFSFLDSYTASAANVQIVVKGLLAKIVFTQNGDKIFPFDFDAFDNFLLTVD